MESEVKHTVKTLCQNISRWRLSTNRESAEYVGAIAKNKGKTELGPKPLHFDVSSSISPVDMFCYLRFKFGPPNGFQMNLKTKNDVDNLIHWSYEIKLDGTIIYFSGFFFHFSIIVGNFDTPSHDDKDALIETLAGEVSLNRTEVERIKSTLEEWIVFSNPYFQLSDWVEYLVDEIKTEEPLRRFNKRPDNAIEVQTTSNANTKMFSKSFQNRTTLKLIIPIWIESFINLVIFTCTKPEKRKDEKAYAEYKRSRWLTRVRQLNTFCHGIQKPIEGNEFEVEQIKPIFNTRNRLLHGGISPEVAGRKIYFADRYIPLMNENSYLTNFLHDISLYGLDNLLLEQEVEKAQKFISFILERLEEDILKQLVHIMNDSIPGWDPKRMMPGSIMPPTFVDMFPVFNENNRVTKDSN